MKTYLISLVALSTLAPLSTVSGRDSDFDTWRGPSVRHEAIGHQPGRGSHRPDVLLFEHAYRRGEAVGLHAGDEIVDLRNLARFNDDWNDAISSIRVTDGIEVWLYEHAGFRGDRIRITSSQNDLNYLRNREGWNDRVSSIRVVREHQRYDSSRHDRDKEDRVRNERQPEKNRGEHGSSRRRPVATLYEHSGYSGDALSLFPGQSIPNLAPVPGGWNDSISSIHLDSSTVIELYEHAGFRGRKLVVTSSQGNLAYPRAHSSYARGESWNDRVSSIRVLSR